MGLCGSPYDYVIHVGIIATTRVTLITGFQPPLVGMAPKLKMAATLLAQMSTRGGTTWVKCVWNVITVDKYSVL